MWAGQEVQVLLPDLSEILIYEADDLAKLGAKRLATILVELSSCAAGFAALVLASAELKGADPLAEVVADRLALLKRTDQWVPWDQTGDVVATIGVLGNVIADGIGKHDPDRALALMHALLGLAGQIISNAENHSSVEAAFDDAGGLLGPLLRASRRTSEERAQYVISLVDCNGAEFTQGMFETAALGLDKATLSAIRRELEARRPEKPWYLPDYLRVLDFAAQGSMVVTRPGSHL
jgi:hypothetical protein